MSSPFSAPPDRSVPHIFDGLALRRFLKRANRQGREDFLYQRLAEDAAERLSAVLRSFSQAADIGTPSSCTIQTLRSLSNIDQITQYAPIAELITEQGKVVEDEALELEPESLDLITSVAALQCVNDLPGVLLQIRRALRPDGLFLGAIIGGESLRELRQILTTAEIDITGGASPRVAPLPDLRDIGALIQRAGFALPVIDSEMITVRYDHLFALLKDLRAMGGSNSLVARNRKNIRKEVFIRAAQLYAEQFSDSDGRIRARFEVIWALGWAPHENQQKPLRPGTAQVSLAEALRPASAKSSES